MSAWDDQLRLACAPVLAAGELRVLADDDPPFFQRLGAVFPACGSKIDWAAVPGSIERYQPDHSAHVASFAAFFDEMCDAFDLQGPIRYGGDSLTDFILEGSVQAFRQILAELAEIPQHHYFLGPDAAWCLCLTMEGDMAFGRAPSVPHLQGNTP